MEQKYNICNLVLEYFIDIGKLGYWLSCFIDDKARTSLIWKVINTFSRNNFDEFDMCVFLGNGRQMLIDQQAKLIIILVQVKNNERFGICFGHLSDVLISRNFEDPSIFLFDRFDFEFLHAACHILSCEIIVDI
jgi:hypothetical protein